MSRRALLQWAGAGTAASVIPTFGSCDSRGAHTPAAPDASGGPLQASCPPDWTALRGRLSGSLILPGDAPYENARVAYNTLFDGQRPTAIAQCATPSDVQASLDAARGCGLPIAARSGGHSYGGYSNPNGGLVLDVSTMSNMTVQKDGTAIVGAGARLIDVYAALASAGRCLPGGTCPTVGIAGLTLGGGIGVTTRLFGLTCDNLISADLVLADSSLRTASRHDADDLYWALRGGGGGNFGVVTSFVFRTHPIPDQVTVFSLDFPNGSVPEVLGAWQDWQPDMPNELWSNCVVFSGNPPGVNVGGCFVGSPSDLAPLLDDLVARAQVQPQDRSATPMGYFDAMMAFAGCTGHTVAECHRIDQGGIVDRHASIASSRILGAPMRDPSRIDALLRTDPGIFMLFDSLGGAVDDISPDHTAFAHRRALASVQINRGVTTSDDAAAIRQEITQAQMDLAGIVGSGAYVNYIDPAMTDWASACYGANLPRLRAIAKRYDPNGVFAFAQNVGDT